MKELVNLDSPNAIRIGVISDNLHTHNPAFLSAVFEPAEAKRIWDKLEFHYTAKDGLDQVQSLVRECLDGGIGDRRNSDPGN